MSSNDNLSELPPYRRLDEARRGWGSEWIKDHSRALEVFYDLTKRLVFRSYPLMRWLGSAASSRLMVWGERALKGWVFNCQMCGQCILHSTGMTCPMNCPKNLRNGPCGGVRPNEHCEVIPERMCVWVQAWKRSRKMKGYADDLSVLQPPVNHALKNTSAWLNMIEERDTPPKAWTAFHEAGPEGGTR
jgi:hypothetical protein